MNLEHNFSVENIDEKYCDHFRNTHSCGAKERKSMESKFLHFRKYSKEEIAKTLLTYSLFEPDYCIKLARKKGIFRYSEGSGYAAYCMTELLKYKDYFSFSEDTVSYLENKLDNKWMEEYFIKSEGKIRKQISEHHQKRIRKNVGGQCLETSLIIELLSYLEMVFRLGISQLTKRAAQQRLDRNSIKDFSQEEIAEGISYLIYLSCEMNPVREKRILWLDTSYVNSDRMDQLIVEACKRNLLIEWELMIDYLGYSVKRNGDKIRIYDAGIRTEKNIRLGYIKRQMQEQLLYLNTTQEEEEDSLQKRARYLVDELNEGLFVLKNEHPMIQRYQLQFPGMLLNGLLPDSKDRPRLFAEEFDYVQLICKEQMISIDDFYSLQVTEHCTAIDVMMFKRYIMLVVIMQNYLWKNKLYEDKKNLCIMERSVVPTFRESEILQLLTPFLQSEEKVKELLDLMTWDGREKLDLQYTPIVKLADHYFLAADVFTVSNSVRNIIVRARSRNIQIVNSDGSFNPLEQCCKECFEESPFPFKFDQGLRYDYNGKCGEIDFLAWTDDCLYVFECKNAIVPAGNFELRTTFDYIEKAQQQLNLSKKALTDSNFRSRYFPGWNIPDAGKTRKIRTCILLGNRLFSAYSIGGHPVRYIYELNMVLNGGYIKNETGTWRYWKNETFSEEDLQLFLSDDDTLSKSLLEAMPEYHECTEYMKKQVDCISYKLNGDELIKRQNKYFTVIAESEKTQ